jgi:hypothetical protein
MASQAGYRRSRVPRHLPRSRANPLCLKRVACQTNLARDMASANGPMCPTPTFAARANIPTRFLRFNTTATKTSSRAGSSPAHRVSPSRGRSRAFSLFPIRRIASPDHSLLTAIEGRALQSKGNEPLPWRVLQVEFGARTPGENASAEPSTKNGLKLFTPVPSLFRARPAIDTLSQFFL